MPAGYAALAADRGACQPRCALCRHHPGGDAGLGAFRRAYAELFGLVRPVSRPADYLARQGGGAAYEDRHIFFAYVLLALIVIHLAAALWHHFIRRDRVAARMIDGTPG